MDLTIDTNKANNAQIARILTENRVKVNSFCPNCGGKCKLKNYERIKHTRRI